MSNRRVTEVRGRPFKVGLPQDALVRVQEGAFKTRYRGLVCCKNPFDLVLYVQLLERLRPRTIIEVGSFAGGSALWLRDQVRALEIECAIISIDIRPPHQQFDGVVFCPGDSFAPETSFPNDAIAAAPHPWLVIEDSAHRYESTLAVLRYFDPRLEKGDYVVVEDGVLADLPGDSYAMLADGPNRAVAAFLTSTGDRYDIDVGLCDYYGPNVTYCPNGWLVRC